MQIRRENDHDIPAIAEINRQAFSGEKEVALIEKLRADGLVTLSLIAEEDAQILGHILFSPVNVVVDGRPVKAVSLAPMAVLPSRQKQGIGSLLVRAGLDTVSFLGIEAVIVVGHKTYYPRFGFSAALARKLDSPFTGDAFMALEIVPDALHGTRGKVTWPPAFEITNKPVPHKS